MRLRLVTSALLVLFNSLAIGAQSPASAPTPNELADSVRRAIETSTELGDLAGIENAVALAERAAGAGEGSALLQHYHAYGLYRAGSLVLGRDGTARARPYFDRARDELETLVNGSTIPESVALLSAVYGMQIASAKVQFIAGMRLGPKSGAMIDSAVALAPRNPRIWLIRGIVAFNTPGSFGGGVDKAEAALKRAIELFAGDTVAPPLPSWGRAEAHIWLGRTYVRESRRDAARAEYQAALTLQSHNAWLTSTLIPALNRETP